MLGVQPTEETSARFEELHGLQFYRLVSVELVQNIPDKMTSRIGDREVWEDMEASLSRVPSWPWVF